MTLRLTGAPARSPRPTSGPHNAKAPPKRKAQSVKRIDFSLQTSKVSASLLPPPSKVAATETVQPCIFGSFTVARALGASGFESLVVLSPAVMTTPVTGLAGVRPGPPHGKAALADLQELLSNLGKDGVREERKG